jgi:hypothetical protein
MRCGVTPRFPALQRTLGAPFKPRFLGLSGTRSTQRRPRLPLEVCIDGETEHRGNLRTTPSRRLESKTTNDKKKAQLVLWYPTQAQKRA